MSRGSAGGNSPARTPRVSGSRSFDDIVVEPSEEGEPRDRAMTEPPGSMAGLERPGRTSSGASPAAMSDLFASSVVTPVLTPTGSAGGSSAFQHQPAAVDEISVTSKDASLQAESDDDDEIRAAKEMALLLQQNPNLTPDQIRQLVLGKNSSSDKKKSPSMFKKSNLGKIHGSINKYASKGLSTMVGLNRNTSGGGAGILSSGNRKDKPPSPSMFAIPSPAVSTSRKTATSPKSHKAISTSPKSFLQPLPQQESYTTPRAGTSIRSATPDPLLDTVSSQDDNETNTKDSRIRITGIIWKRRSGLGKYSVNAAWERRRVVLRGTKLYYYKTSVDNADESTGDGETTNVDTEQVPSPDLKATKTWLEQATAVVNSMSVSTAGGSANTKGGARGYLDLIKERASVGASLGHSGAPTPFALSIKVMAQTKWKLCFDTHGELMEWLAAMTDVVVQGSVDAYNSQILQIYDPTVDSTLSYQGQLSEPPLIASSGSKEGSGGHRLWETGHYRVMSADAIEEDLDELEEVASDIEEEDAADAHADVQPENKHAEALVKEVWAIPEPYMVHLTLLLNLAILTARSSATTVETFWFLLTLTNMGLFALLKKEKVGGSIAAKTETPNAVLDRKLSSRLASQHNLTASKDGLDEGPTNTKPAIVKTASMLGEFKPAAGTSTMRILNPTDLPVNKDGHVFAGWRRADPETMFIRSHGYGSTKKKVPSPGQLYECAHVDIFEAPSRCPDMASCVRLPKLDFGDGAQPKTWNAPDIFVVSIALPTDPPKLYGSSDDGGGYTITIYFTMEKETREILRRVTSDGYDASTETVDDVQKSKVNAVRLLEEWCRRAPTDDKFMSRFKVIPNAQNLKEIGLPGWIAKYNGKPFLIKRPGQTGFLYRHPEMSCMEFDISLHPFPYLAKQGICFMKDTYFKKVLVTFGFVIEGRSDDELPECIIGLMQLCYPDPIHAIQGADFFSGRSPRSFDT